MKRSGRHRTGRLRATWDDGPLERASATAFKLTPKKKVSELSRGMGMKLTLAFALAHHPQLLVLDEATAGLDPLARDEVLDILRDFVAEGDRGILMSTHITSDLEKIADEIVCVDNGAIVFSAPKDAITDEAGVARCRAAEVDGPARQPALWPRVPPACCATTTAWTCSCPTASPPPVPSPTWWWTRPPSKIT